MVEVTNTEIEKEVISAYLSRYLAGKLDKNLDRNPGLLIIGYTGTGKSSSVYSAAEKLAEMFGKELFIYGYHTLDIDTDKLAYKYRQLLHDLNAVVQKLDKNGQLERDEDGTPMITDKKIVDEVITEIVKETFMDMTLDRLFTLLQAVRTTNVNTDEMLQLKMKYDELEEKIMNGTINEKEFEEYQKLEKKIEKIKESGKTGKFIFVDFDLNQVESVDMTGVIVKTSMGFRYLPPLWALLIKQHGGILFLDEFTNVESNEKKSISYRIVFSKKIGEVYLDRRTLVVAAGNTQKDSSIAGELAYPLLNRFAVIEVTSVDQKGTINIYLKNYGSSKVAIKVAAFLASSTFNTLLDLPQSDVKETLKPFQTPRSWEYVIRELMSLNGDIDDPATDMLLKLYGLQKGEIANSRSKKIRNIVARVAKKYVKPSTAEVFASQWVEQVIEPQELFKDPELFARTYKKDISMASLQTVFLYTQWAIEQVSKKIKEYTTKKRLTSTLFYKIVDQVVQPYAEPIKVMIHQHHDYFSFIAGYMNSLDRKTYLYFVPALNKDPEIARSISEVNKRLGYQFT